MHLPTGLLEVLYHALPMAPVVGRPGSQNMNSSYRLPGEVLLWRFTQPGKADGGGAGTSDATHAETLEDAIKRHPQSGEYIKEVASM